MCSGMNIVIFSVFYNRGKQANDSIESLLKAAPDDAKVVLVDDGSTDDTVEQLKKFESDKRVVVESQPNQGFTKALISAIDKYADPVLYHYMGIHGSGDLCEEDKFTKQLEYLEKHTDIAALGTGHTVRSYSTKNVVLEENDEYEATMENLDQRVPFTHGTVIYRLEDYFAVGGYSPVFKFSQDKDLYFKLIKRGRIVRYPEALYTQFVFEDSASANPKKKRAQMKYQKLIKLQYEDPKLYNEKVAALESLDIHDVFPDKDLLDKFLWAQRRLIYQGEFELASEWCDWIYSVNKSNKQLRLKHTLLIAGKIPLMKWLTARSFYLGRKLLR